MRVRNPMIYLDDVWHILDTTNHRISDTLVANPYA